MRFDSNDVIRVIKQSRQPHVTVDCSHAPGKLKIEPRKQSRPNSHASVGSLDLRIDRPPRQRPILATPEKQSRSYIMPVKVRFQKRRTSNSGSDKCARLDTRGTRHTYVTYYVLHAYACKHGNKLMSWGIHTDTLS
jgi:hypothetical protein